MKKDNKNSGQIVLMVLLTMVVGLTIALGIFADSLTDTALTISQENSEKAFNLAEAGIENLLAGKDTINIVDDDFTIEAKTEQDEFLETYVKQNETVEIKLVEGEKTISKVDIYWVDKNDPDQYLEDSCEVNRGGLILTLVNDIGNKYFAFKSIGDCAVEGDGFISSGSSSYDSYLNELDDFETTGYKLLRIRPVFNNVNVKVDSGQGIAQQYRYESLATANETMESRKIEVVRTLPSLPEVFDYTLFSGGTIN